MSLNLAYAAGLIDGEGCIHLDVTAGKYFKPRVSVGMTEPAKFLLDDMQQEWGGTLYQLRKPTDRWAGAWTWHMTAKDAVTFLEAIRPYLRLKGEQADLALEVWNVWLGLEDRWGGQKLWTETAREQCRQIQAQLADLNMKGPNRPVKSVEAA